MPDLKYDQIDKSIMAENLRFNFEALNNGGGGTDGSMINMLFPTIYNVDVYTDTEVFFYKNNKQWPIDIDAISMELEYINNFTYNLKYTGKVKAINAETKKALGLTKSTHISLTMIEVPNDISLLTFNGNMVEQDELYNNGQKTFYTAAVGLFKQGETFVPENNIKAKYGPFTINYNMDYSNVKDDKPFVPELIINPYLTSNDNNQGKIIFTTSGTMHNSCSPQTLYKLYDGKEFPEWYNLFAGDNSRQTITIQNSGTRETEMGFNFNNTKRIVKVEIQPSTYTSSGVYAPTTAVVQYSNDGIKWDNASEIISIDSTSNKKITIENFDIITNNIRIKFYSDKEFFSISEIKFYGGDA